MKEVKNPSKELLGALGKLLKEKRSSANGMLAMRSEDLPPELRALMEKELGVENSGAAEALLPDLVVGVENSAKFTSGISMSSSHPGRMVPTLVAVLPFNDGEKTVAIEFSSREALQDLMFCLSAMLVGLAYENLDKAKEQLTPPLDTDEKLN